MQEKELLEEILVQLKVISKFLSITGIAIYEEVRDEEVEGRRELDDGEYTYLSAEDSVRYSYNEEKNIKKKQEEENRYKRR